MSTTTEPTTVTDPDTDRTYSRDAAGIYSSTQDDGRRVPVHPDGPLAARLDAVVPTVNLTDPDLPELIAKAEARGWSPADLLVETIREELNEVEPVDRERAAAKAFRPYWQTMDCPSWCISEHTDSGSRTHAGVINRVYPSRPSLNDPEAGSTVGARACFNVRVDRHDHDREALITTGHNSNRVNYLHLTAAEAREYAGQLLAAADTAEGIA